MKKPDTHYLKDQTLDVLARTDTELLSELWILADRAAVLEQILIDKGLLQPGEVDEYVPDEQMSLRLEQMRDQLVRRVLASPFVDEYSVDSLKAQGQK